MFTTSAIDIFLSQLRPVTDCTLLAKFWYQACFIYRYRFADIALLISNRAQTHPVERYSNHACWILFVYYSYDYLPPMSLIFRS